MFGITHIISGASTGFLRDSQTQINLKDFNASITTMLKTRALLGSSGVRPALRTSSGAGGCNDYKIRHLLLFHISQARDVINFILLIKCCVVETLS